MKKIIKALLVLSIAITSNAIAEQTMVQNKPALKAEQVSSNIAVIKLGDYQVHTFYGVSNSHIIETPKQLILVDMQFLQPHAGALQKYIRLLKKPLKKIILSHSHPDHWFGYENFPLTPLTTPGVKQDLDNRGAEYIKIMKTKLNNMLPEKVVNVNTDIQLGSTSWDGLKIIIEEYTKHEAHHSIVIKLPDYGVIIGQDLFYNNAHLVASNLERNKNWVKLLQKFKKNEAKTYHTFLTGHGLNTNADVLLQDIEYLIALDKIITSGVSKEEAKQQLLKKFPNKNTKTQNFIDITLRNLFKKNHK